MDSLRTGTTYSCVIVAPLALSPIAALFIADAVTRVVHRAKDRAAEKASSCHSPSSSAGPPA